MSTQSTCDSRARLQLSVTVACYCCCCWQCPGAVERNAKRYVRCDHSRSLMLRRGANPRRIPLVTGVRVMELTTKAIKHCIHGGCAPSQLICSGRLSLYFLCTHRGGRRLRECVSSDAGHHAQRHWQRAQMECEACELVSPSVSVIVTCVRTHSAVAW